MSNQPRVVKVLAALLISMTTGAVVLMALGDNPPSKPLFCLSAYYRLDSVDHALRCRIDSSRSHWSSIDIAFSGTKGGNIQRLATVRGLTNPADLDCHFLVGNGVGAGDGEIQTTENWLSQCRIRPAAAWRGDEQTIRICLVGNGVSSLPTDYQLKRLEMLLESLGRKFDISPEAVHLPRDVQ